MKQIILLLLVVLNLANLKLETLNLKLETYTMKRIFLSTTLFILFCVLLQSCTNDKVRIINLMVEYVENPLGMDEAAPRFSWQMENRTGERGYKQVACQLTVSDESGKEVWNTGKTQNDRSLNIIYEGAPLKSTTRYSWKVDVWDQKGVMSSASSWFETGLMNPDPNLSAWNGAKWIGGGDDDLVIYPSYLSVFKLNYSLQLDKESKTTSAGFLYGVNDSRLLDKNKNMLNIESAKDEPYIMVELDIAGLDKSTAFINIYRNGYHPDDNKDIPFIRFPVPHSLINNANKYDKHTVQISSESGQTQISINSQFVGETFLNPLGKSGDLSSDFISFPMVSEIGYSLRRDQKASFSDVEVRNYRAPSNLLFAGQPEDLQGGENGLVKLINPQRNAMPMLRTTFALRDKKIAKARLYVTARGIYEMYINGSRIGNDYFNPGFTQYTQTHLYQTYDVTGDLNPGTNAMGALLGEGWWSGGITYTPTFWNYFGDRQSLLAQLIVTYENGEQDIIATHPDTWKYFNDGPIVYGSFFQGEVYDASKEAAVKGWDTPDYNDSHWKRTEEVTLENHIATELAPDMPAVDDYSRMNLTGHFSDHVNKVKELTAISIEEVRPGVFVYDMGQNMVGIPRIKLSGMTPGKKITIRYAEVKYPDLPAYKGNIGMIMLENILAALTQDIYLTKGGEETINPRFTFHGYRFLEITGIDKPFPVESVKGDVLSSIGELSSGYETSNDKVNRLWENIVWSTLGNFLSIPTDCPQRNERMGWSGDISVYSRTATYMAHLPQFLRRHMLAMRNTQREDGRFADVAPLGGGFGGVLWGSAGITVAWESFLQYGDKRMLEEHYSAMKQYIDYLRKYIDPKTGILTEGRLGDWLGQEQLKNDNTLLWESYFIYDLEIMAKTAALLGKTEDAKNFEAFHKERKEFFNNTYIDPSTRKTIHSGFKQGKESQAKRGDIIDTQTSYVLPLAFGVYAEEHKEQSIKNLMITLERENHAQSGEVCPPYSLMTGFIGTAWINRVLSDNGLTDAAYRLLQQTSYPSWLYPVEQGATTIWERLNSYTHTDGFGGRNSMNSFNHYSFGAVGSWMYNHSLGIERDDQEPGFKHFILKPEPDPTGGMTFAKGHYHSMYGEIRSNWEIRDGVCYYGFTVPANTTATLYLSAPSPESILESGQPASSADGVKYIGQEGRKFVFELQSGEYKFSSNW